MKASLYTFSSTNMFDTNKTWGAFYHVIKRL